MELFRIKCGWGYAYLIIERLKGLGYRNPFAISEYSGAGRKIFVDMPQKLLDRQY